VIEEHPENLIAFLVQKAVRAFGVVHLLLSWSIMYRIYKFSVAHNENTRLKRLAQKGILYASSVTVIQTPNLLWALVRQVFGFNSETGGLLASTTVPLAGFLNMLVFLLYRREMKTRYGKFARNIVDHAACHKQEGEDSDSPSSSVLGRELFLTTDPMEKEAIEHGPEGAATESSPA